MAARPRWSAGSGLPEKTARIVEEELPRRILLEAGPGEDVIDRFGELAFRMRVVGSIHEDAVTEELGDVIVHVLPFVVLDAAEEAAARHVFARLLLERSGAADIDRLLVHAPRPERQPAE